MQLGVAFHSEVWERKANKKHKYKIEEMSELHNTHYVSTASPDRRGGGCAITCDNSKFHLKELSIDNPDNLEVTFATLRPRYEICYHSLCSLLSTKQQEKFQAY